MNHQPDLATVSVFMSTYNHARFISEAIEGVLIQDYPNIELILGDDFSTDGTREIIEKYQGRYPDRIVALLPEEHQGITDNFNNILACCKGKYIAFTSGDDVWLPGKISRQVEFMERNPSYVMCYTKVAVLDDESGRTIAIYPPDDFDVRNQKNPVDYAYISGTCVTSYLVRNDAIPEHGFIKELQAGNDWYFFIEVLLKGAAGFIDEVYAKYRRHGTNTSKAIEYLYAEHLLMLWFVAKNYPALKSMVDSYRRKYIVARVVCYELQKNDPAFAKQLLFGVVQYARISNILSSVTKVLYKRTMRKVLGVIKNFRLLQKEIL